MLGEGSLRRQMGKSTLTQFGGDPAGLLGAQQRAEPRHRGHLSATSTSD